MALRTISNANVPWVVQIHRIFTRCFASQSTKDILASAEEEPIFEERPADISDFEGKRNKSRLSSEHRRILLGEKPYDTALTWYHDTVRYKRRILGRYGMQALGVPAGLAWPTPEEVEDMKEYERVAFPVSLQDRWDKIKLEKQKKEEYKRTRQLEIEKNMVKMNDWINAVKEKVAKKEQQLEEAKKRKESIIAEVRRHFGFKISEHDQRFKDMLEKKEKEDKKRKKDAKKALKEKRLQQKLEMASQKKEAEKNTDKPTETPME